MVKRVLTRPGYGHGPLVFFLQPCLHLADKLPVNLWPSHRLLLCTCHVQTCVSYKDTLRTFNMQILYFWELYPKVTIFVNQK